jgi:hypothetical protein
MSRILMASASPFPTPASAAGLTLFLQVLEVGKGDGASSLQAGASGQTD